MAAMCDAFKVMFGEVTCNRLSCEFEKKFGRSPEPLDYMDVIDGLNLDDRPYDEWAISIERAIAESLK